MVSQRPFIRASALEPSGSKWITAFINCMAGDSRVREWIYEAPTKHHRATVARASSAEDCPIDLSFDRFRLL